MRTLLVGDLLQQHRLERPLTETGDLAGRQLSQCPELRLAPVPSFLFGWPDELQFCVDQSFPVAVCGDDGPFSVMCESKAGAVTLEQARSFRGSVRECVE